MPLLPIAAFLVGALLTMLLPLALLIALAVWYWAVSVRVPDTTDGSEPGTRTGAANLGPSDSRDAPARARGVMQAGAGTKWASRPATARPARIAAVLLAAVIVGLGVGFGVHRLTAGGAAPHATVSTRFGMHGEAAWAEGAHPAPPITTLRDQTGRLFSLSALRGRTVAMMFFDSHCNQACPLEGRALASAERALPAARRPVLVIVSVNPRDTPSSERAAARKWGLAAAGSWYWLSGAHAQLARVWKAYHIFVAADEERHRAYRGPVSDRPRRIRALGLPVPVHPGLRQPGPDVARRLRARACLISPVRFRPPPGAGAVARGHRGARHLARLRDADQAADHVAAGADLGLRDDRGRRR